MGTSVRPVRHEVDFPVPVPRLPARSLQGLIGTAVSLALLTSCTGTQADAAPAQPARTPVVDETTALAVFSTLSTTRSAANTARDSQALATVVTGPALRSSAFTYATQAVQATPPIAPYLSTPGTLAAPEDGTADWFYSVRATGDPAASDRDFVESTLFTRDTAGSPWLLTYQLTTDPGVALPQPALVGGSAVLPDDAAHARGDLALQEVLDYARTGQGAATLDVADADQLGTAHSQGFPVPDLGPESGTEERVCALEGPPPAWVAATEGIFAMVSIECTQTVTLTGGWAAPTPTTSTLGTVPAGARLSAWTVTQTLTALVEVHDDGTSRVVGSRLRPVRTDVTLAP